MTAPARPVLPSEGRVLDVLVLLAEGYTLQQIAREWGVEPGTVRIYAARLRRYLGAETNPEAVLLGCRAGLLDGRPQGHGDHNGYETHVRRRTKICDRCRDGEKAYRAGLREARRTQEGPCVPLSRPNGAPATSGLSGLESASEAHSPASRPTNQTKAA